VVVTLRPQRISVPFCTTTNGLGPRRNGADCLRGHTLSHYHDASTHSEEPRLAPFQPGVKEPPGDLVRGERAKQRPSSPASWRVHFLVPSPLPAPLPTTTLQSLPQSSNAGYSRTFRTPAGNVSAPFIVPQLIASHALTRSIGSCRQALKEGFENRLSYLSRASFPPSVSRICVQTKPTRFSAAPS